MLIEALEQFSLFRTSFEIMLPAVPTDPIRSVPVLSACPQRKYGQCKTIHSKLRMTIIREWCPINNIRILSFTSVRIEDNSPLEFFQITSGFFLFENHLASQQKTTSGLSTTIVKTATVQILASKKGGVPFEMQPYFRYGSLWSSMITMITSSALILSFIPILSQVQLLHLESWCEARSASWKRAFRSALLCAHARALLSSSLSMITPNLSFASLALDRLWYS